MKQRSGFTKLTRAKQLLHVMAAQSVSVYANQVIAFVIPWLVLTRTGSAANAGLVAFATGFAAFIGILTGGIITDRIGGRKVSIIADSLSLVTALLLAAVLFFDYFSLWLVIVSQVIGVFFDGPGAIAKNTMVPAAAAAEKVPIVRAMGLQQTLQNMAMFVGPVSAGLIVAVLSESLTLGFAGMLFVVAIALVAKLKRQILNHEHPVSARQVIVDTKEAISFLVHDRFLGPMQLFGPLFAFVLVPITTVIFPAWFVFSGQGAGALGFFLGIQAIGGMLGGLLFAKFAPKVPQRAWFFGATATYACALLGLYFQPPGSLFVIATGMVAGLAFTGIMAIPYTAFYARTPERLLGRVNSLGAASGFLIAAIASPIFGLFITATSPRSAILACSVGMMILALGILTLPFMRYLDEAPTPTTLGQGSA